MTDTLRQFNTRKMHSLIQEYNKGYQQGKADGAREFAEVIKSQSSEMVQAFIDRQLAEWQKGTET